MYIIHHQEGMMIRNGVVYMTFLLSLPHGWEEWRHQVK